MPEICVSLMIYAAMCSGLSSTSGILWIKVRCFTDAHQSAACYVQQKGHLRLWGKTSLRFGKTEHVFLALRPATVDSNGEAKHSNTREKTHLTFLPAITLMNNIKGDNGLETLSHYSIWFKKMSIIWQVLFALPSGTPLNTLMGTCGAAHPLHKWACCT